MRKVIGNVCCVLLISTLTNAGSASEDRLMVDARINGKGVRLTFDTGTSFSLVITRRTADKLSLDTEHQYGFDIATFAFECLGGKVDDAKAIVIDLPPQAEFDGLIGWPGFRNKIWRVQWDDMALKQIPFVPEEVLSWQVLDLDSRVGKAAAFVGGDEAGLIYIDTGATGDISLSEARWDKWVQSTPDIPMTLASAYSPAVGGWFVTGQVWADKIQLGQVTFPGVMITQDFFKSTRLEAHIGLGAMKHFEIVFDCTQNRIYMTKRPNFHEPVEYNRLGATFSPESPDSNELVCHVLKDSPAYRAGLRPGDILLRTDDTDMTKWKSDPAISEFKPWFQAAGTRYEVEIERDGRTHVFQVVLEEILDVPDRNGRPTERSN